MQVQEVMTAAVACCTPNEAAQRAAQIMRESDSGVIPVLAGEDDPKIIGIVTDRDLCMKVIAEGRDPRKVAVQECMTSNVVAVKPEDDIEHAADLMSEKQVRRLPVINDQGAIVGIVSLADIAQSPAQAAQVGETVYDISERTRDASVPRGGEKD